MKTILLLMMGGSGTRLGAAVPKQYLEIDGHPIFYYIVQKYVSMKEISAICIVSHPDWLDFVSKAVKDLGSRVTLRIVSGGDSRSGSVRNGLRAVEDIAGKEDVVLIHDATHPYVDVEGVNAVIKMVKKWGGATLGACQYDTCYQINGEKDLVQVVPRQELVSGASPEGFRFGDISRIYFDASEEELGEMTSAGAIALAHRIPIKVIPSSVLNLKITYPEDLKLFRLLVHSYFFNDAEGE